MLSMAVCVDDADLFSTVAVPTGGSLDDDPSSDLESTGHNGIQPGKIVQ